MFGGFHSTARNSSVRSGAADLPDHDEEEELAEHDIERRGPSSSEEAEERRRGRVGCNASPSGGGMQGGRVVNWSM